MPKITAYAAIFRDWDGLIGACSKNAEQLPAVEALRKDLEARLAELKALKVEQENLVGARKAMTQRLGVLVDEGRETARKIRGFVVGQLGSRNKQLSQFGIPTIGNRVRKASIKAPATPPPVEGSASQPSQPSQKAQAPDVQEPA
jgi:hypothetical protein